MPRLEKMSDDTTSEECANYLREDKLKRQERTNSGYNFPIKMPSSYYAYEPSVQEVYVNVKQFDAIKKRKARRDYLDSLMEIQKSNYLHESRHIHAMNRLRAPSGRFLTKEEMADMRKYKKGDSDDRM